MGSILCITPPYVQQKFKLREHLLCFERSKLSEHELRQVVLFNFDIENDPGGNQRLVVHPT